MLAIVLLTTFSLSTSAQATVIRRAGKRVFYCRAHHCIWIQIGVVTNSSTLARGISILYKRTYGPSIVCTVSVTCASRAGILRIGIQKFRSAMGRDGRCFSVLSEDAADSTLGIVGKFCTTYSGIQEPNRHARTEQGRSVWCLPVPPPVHCRRFCAEWPN